LASFYFNFSWCPPIKISWKKIYCSNDVSTDYCDDFNRYDYCSTYCGKKCNESNSWCWHLCYFCPIEPNGQLGYELKEDAKPLTIGEFKKMMNANLPELSTDVHLNGK